MIEISTPAVPAVARFAARHNVPASAVVKAGDWVFVSGMPPVNPETGGYDILTIDQQARRSLDYLKSCLEAAGSGLDRVVKCTVYCSNPSYFPTVNAIYAEYFGAHKPARAFISPGGWFGSFDIEFDCIALVK
jgi:2-iminobutanoate/2-iminopropanoate deaminase